MGLLKSIFTRRRAKARETVITDAEQRRQELLRRCHFEIMEERRVLSADPVIAGATYIEGDAGQDTNPDYFEVTFQGGADTTQLTQFVINGDQNGDGVRSDGDMFFDATAAAPGTGGYHAFQFDAANSTGLSAADIRGVNVSADGLVLTVDVENFEAGDVLAFTIDVDEVEGLRDDKIASGVEFESTQFQATFVDENYTFEALDISVNTLVDGQYPQTQTSGLFYDYYDDLLSAAGLAAGNGLELDLDNQTGQADRSDGAIDAYELIPKPITISGTVWHDENLDCEHGSNEDGIANVHISLQKLNESTGQYEEVATTTTNAQGDYEFGLDLNLTPGEYQLVETQPEGYLDVGAHAGNVEGVETGLVEGVAGQNQNVITGINIPLGGTAATDYNFKEIRPASISGNVWHDENNDGVFDANETGISNVLIQITRVGAKDGVTDDPFADTTPIFVRTDVKGHYSVDSLPPGVYEIVEINNYPPSEVDPLATYIDGKDSTGNILGETVGTKSNDRFNTVTLCAGDEGVEYNFGEIRPSSISGHVSVATPEGDCYDPTDPDYVGIEGVTIELFDQTGSLVGTTQTNGNGFYQFDDLAPGTYTVVEVQPDGYLDAGDGLGQVNGEDAGRLFGNDRFTNITLTSGDVGVNYDFCEHIPAQLKGTVWHDANDDGVLDAGEDRIGNVLIQLFNEQGDLVSETRTDANGEYCFEDLYPGTYTVKEIQPTSFVDGQDALGSVGQNPVGQVADDMFMGIVLNGGDIGTNYDFGEIRLGSIGGMVHADVNGDCVFDSSEGDQALEGVELVLLNDAGDEVARTFTDVDGRYMFDGLRPGNYTVREVQPDGYLDGAETAGTIGGAIVGTTSDDVVSGIALASGADAVNYDFCEHIPATLKGTVYHDVNNDGRQDAGEEGIEGVRLVLTDADGNVVAETFTDAEGNYCFEDLLAGEYKLQEFQPDGYVDGKESTGTVDGDVVGFHENDVFCDIVLRGGDDAVDYDFGEIKLATISGVVHADLNGDCVFDPSLGEETLEGVTLELLDAQGDVIATTVTNANGEYEFTGVLPGEYSVREQQPDGYFDQGQVAGSHDGDDSGENIITGIMVQSGQNLTQYNFCEVEQAEIHGRVWEDGPAFRTEDGNVPDDYRDQRDGVFDPAVDTPIAGVRMQLYFYADPETGNIAPRPVTLGEVLGEHYAHMGTSDPTAEVWVETMDNGEYWFTGLQPGNYIVLEVQPDGFVDANDIPGTTTGVTFNDSGDAQVAIFSGGLSTFSQDQVMDSVTNIRVNAGGVSLLNNFTEVRAVQTDTRIDPNPPGRPPVPPGNPLTPRPGLTGLPGLAGSQNGSYSEFVGTSGGINVAAQVAGPAVEPYTWHLSVVNGGQPRSVHEGHIDDVQDLQVGYLHNTDWSRFDMTSGMWTFTESDLNGDYAVSSRNIEFGMIDGTPLAGDFDGDGTDEVAVFKDGYWLIDVNHNGRWDDSDLMARLGDFEDRPVVGDWDGDGKDDIGIYGPIWERDPEAIAHEPGLPNPANDPYTRPKNVPPVNEDATNGARVLKLTAYGRQRADVVDHVFGTGEREDVPVTGDWNGNGIRSIGIFNGGTWKLDVNGDGEFDHTDVTANFGRAGDIPLIGDFNGDGVEEIAVYRSGTWLIDTNGNLEFDATDRTFKLGGAGDKPVVGDWDGDGKDEPGLYADRG
ncbi:MAG: SdrD B-like domain-containing protein, partial [Planctomycetota bacterium]